MNCFIGFCRIFAEVLIIFAEKNLEMAEIINQIPGFENGTVRYLEGVEEENALLLIARMATEVLNEYNTNVAAFSLTGCSAALEDLVKNESAVAKFYTVDQKNSDLQVILRKAQGMVNRKFVRVIFIEGFSGLKAAGRRWLAQLAQSTNTSIIVL